MGLPTIKYRNIDLKNEQGVKIIKNQTTRLFLVALSLVFVFTLCSAVSAAEDPTLNTTIGSWETSGLDSNNVNVGPNQTLVQVRVENNDTTDAHDVNVTFTWDNTPSPNYINLAQGESTVKNLGIITPGEVKYAFFLMEITRADGIYPAGAYYQNRTFTTTTAGSNTPTYTNPSYIFGERLISQNRNNILSVTTSNPNPSPGELFTVTVTGKTASANYQTVNMPLINYDPASIQPVNVTTTYGANVTDLLKIDTPNTTNFVSVWTFIALAEGTQTLYSYIHDHSGNSDHYNSDYGDEVVVVNVTNRADLVILKTVGDSSTNVGQIIHYYLSVTNNGPNNATGVVVLDTLPSQVTFISATPSAGVSVVGNLLTWTIDNLDVDDIVTLDILVRIDQAGEFTNIANVTGNEQDPNLSNNHDSVTVNAQQPTADLGISKTVDKLVPHLGDTVTFHIVVTNDGHDEATDVVVSDIFPAGLIGINIGTPSQGTFTFIGGILTWNVGNLAPEASANLEITSVVNQTGTIINTANVTATTFDPYPDNNNSTVTVNGQPVADLGIIKEVNNNNPTQGQSVSFTLAVYNNGPSTANNIKVTDLWPIGLGTPIEDSISAGTWSFTPLIGDPLYSGILYWNVTSLTSGSSAQLVINATADQLGQLNNTATVTGDEYDPIMTNNHALVTLNVEEPYIPVTSLSMQKIADVTMPPVGDVVTFTIHITNNGPDTAYNVVVDDAIPAGLIYITGSATPSVGNVNYAGGILSWFGFDLLDEQTEYLTFQVNTTTQTGFITNLANATAYANITDPNTKTEASTGETIEVLPVADIGVEKTGTPTTQNYGQEVTYHISVTNYGPNDATGVHVVDLLPDQTSLLFVRVANISQGTYDSLSGIWQVGDLANGTSATIDLVFKVNRTNTTLNNTATKTYANELDHNTSNDSSEASVEVPPAADLSITKAVSNPQPYVHETITYKLIVQNHGPDDATAVYVVDQLPASVNYVSSSANYGSYNHNTGIWTIGDLPSGAVAQLNIVVTVEKVGPIENHAHVYSNTYDPIINNQDAYATVTVHSTEEQVEVSAKTIGMQKTGVPFGILVLALLMILSGCVINNKR
ncbi:DUF11 domain-containing protein [Methanobacterium petrolearium]|uniref:DUF11 domain-containing protein n=1 Tax=Methanobacterium petrolearium TaxID=710190 RepID=UPI001AE8A727|nr:DUF11 domain-containing protein [Methanobacterium petrolearium]MBP1945984.1 putative repeat protein (TIGR01451 family) [Methanobacterium petrolearium]BDZ72197.1 hypothetical protein GCM10025861_27140 [Methanobacterium petrolearium]